MIDTLTQEGRRRALDILSRMHQARDHGRFRREWVVGNKDPLFRFLGRIVVQENGCWNWIGAHSKGSLGYGTLSLNGQTAYVHAQSYRWFVGPIPPGMCVRHSCDNPKCCNPAHLSLGTAKDNAADMISKGRGRPQLTHMEVLIAVLHDAPEDEVGEALQVSAYAVRETRKGRRHSDITGIEPPAKRADA